MTDHTQFTTTGSLKQRGVFDAVKAPAKVIQREVAFKPLPMIMDVALTEIPHTLNVFNNMYVAAGNRCAAGQGIYTTTDIVNGVWTRQGLASGVDSASQSETELQLYNSSQPGSTASNNYFTTNGTTYASAAQTNTPTNRVHLYANGLWVMLGAGGATNTSIYTSTDNRSYTIKTISQAIGASFNSTATMIYFAGAHRIFFDQAKQFYSTDNGATWTFSATTATIDMVTTASWQNKQQQLAVVGSRLYRFVNVATSTYRGYLACEYTLDGTTWTGFENLTNLRPELTTDVELHGYFGSGLNSFVSVITSIGIPRKPPNLGVEIDGSVYIPIKSVKLGTVLYTGSVPQWPIICGVHVLQIRPDFSMEIHDVMTNVGTDMPLATIANSYVPNGFAGYLNFHLVKGLSNELIVHPIMPSTSYAPIITQPYIADFSAKELVLEYS